MSGREWLNCELCGEYRPLEAAWQGSNGAWTIFVCDECLNPEAKTVSEREDDDIRYHTEMESKS